MTGPVTPARDIHDAELLILEFRPEPHAKKARLGKRTNKTPNKKANARVAAELSCTKTLTTLASPISPQIPATLIKTRPSVRLSPTTACPVTTGAEPGLDACGATLGAEAVVDTCWAALGTEAVVDACGAALGAETGLDSCGATLGAVAVVDGPEVGPTGPVADGFSRREPHHGHESYKSR